MGGYLLSYIIQVILSQPVPSPTGIVASPSEIRPKYYLIKLGNFGEEL